jgi:hypothetical protein
MRKVASTAHDTFHHRLLSVGCRFHFFRDHKAPFNIRGWSTPGQFHQAKTYNHLGFEAEAHGICP